MTVILGIDPGSRFTGYGIIKQQQQQCDYLDSGYIAVANDNLAKKLQRIFNSITEVLHNYQPTTVAVEQVFVHQNARSALKLGEARGVAMAAVAHYGLSFTEYSAKLVKKTVVGYGAANKQQIQHMVRRLLNLSHTPQVDAADALAVALCHAYQQVGRRNLKML